MRLLSFTLVLVLTAGAASIHFDAASVRPDNDSVPAGGMRGGPGTDDPGHFVATRALMRSLLMRAYGVTGDRIRGPSWIENAISPVFSVSATMPPETTKEQFQEMMQNLLAERFHLAAHHEMRDFPAYELVTIDKGQKLRASNPEVAGFPVLPPGMTYLRASSPGGRGVRVNRSTHQETMAAFCARLGAFVNNSTGAPYDAPIPVVVDKTGLAGTYEFHLEFSGSVALPSDLATEVLLRGGTVTPSADDLSAAGPSLFSALEQQLGLRLVKAKSVAVDVVVVDRIEKVPAEN